MSDPKMLTDEEMAEIRWRDAEYGSEQPMGDENHVFVFYDRRALLAHVDALTADIDALNVANHAEVERLNAIGEETARLVVENRALWTEKLTAATARAEKAEAEVEVLKAQMAARTRCPDCGGVVDDRHAEVECSRKPKRAAVIASLQSELARLREAVAGVAREGAVCLEPGCVHVTSGACLRSLVSALSSISAALGTDAKKEGDDVTGWGELAHLRAENDTLRARAESAEAEVTRLLTACDEHSSRWAEAREDLARLREAAGTGAEKLLMLRSYLGHQDQDADHAWMADQMREASAALSAALGTGDAGCLAPAGCRASTLRAEHPFCANCHLAFLKPGTGDAGNGDGDFCACGRRPNECDGSRKGCSR